MGIRKAEGARMRPLLIVAAVAAFMLFVTGCQSDPAPAAAAKKKVVAKKGPAAPTLPSLASGEGGLDEAVGTPEEVFDPKGLRNPFKPFFKVEKKKKKKKSAKVQTFKPKTPLQRFALEELKLVGIVWSETITPEALIEDPTGKGYKVRPGTLVGDRGGKIVRIRSVDLVVEERTIDVLGEKIVKQVTMKLHKPENEVNP